MKGKRVENYFPQISQCSKILTLFTCGQGGNCDDALGMPANVPWKLRLGKV